MIIWTEVNTISTTENADMPAAMPMTAPMFPISAQIWADVLGEFCFPTATHIHLRRFDVHEIVQVLQVDL